MADSALRVLITCRELARRAGSQLYTRDVAEVLRELGHTPIVYTPQPGEVAEELRGRGVPVVDDLARLGALPDVIHGQHHLETMAAVLRFPAVPTLYLCHGWLPFVEAPPHFPTIRAYVAVDALRRDRLVLEHGISDACVTILPNFVDLERFRPRPPLPVRPRRALLFSNQAREGGFAAAVRAACEAEGIELEVAGLGVGRVAARPEELLPAFDLVFARGRAALEAMAVGCAVVLCDVEGSGPLVDRENFAGLRALNFGVGALRGPIAAERLRATIAAYDPVAAAAVQETVRREADRRTAVATLVTLYRRLLDERVEVDASDALAAAARYVAWLSAAAGADERAAIALHAAVQEHALDRTQLAQALLRSELERARLADAARAATEEQERVREVFAVLERSPWMRARERFLRFRPLVSAYRALRRVR